MPDVSVVIATRNRAAMLRACVRAVASQEPPAGGFEIVVVDNASTDATPAVLERLVAEGAGMVRGLRETRLGCAVTRNTGAAAAAGGILVFLDDDAIPHAGWLRGLVVAMRETGAVAVGGLTISVWDASARPAWITDRLRAQFEIPTPEGESRRTIDLPHEYLNPGNLAVRRRDFLAAGGFAEDLGRHGGDTGSFEDHFLLARWAAAGEKLVFEPVARIDHAVHAERLNRRWLLQNHWSEGRHSHVLRRPYPTGRVLLEATLLLPLFALGNLVRGRRDVALIEGLLMVHHARLLWCRLAACRGGSAQGKNA